MGRSREWWRVFLAGVGYGLNVDEGTDRYTVKVRFDLERDPSRVVMLELSPEKADELAESLKVNAEEVRKSNKSYRPPRRARNSDSTARTPENLAYVNGKHSVTVGWPAFSFEEFCQKFHVTPTAENADRLYRRFGAGRQDQLNQQGK